MKLTVIGCGDAFGSGGRFNTCFMIDTASKRLLLDCGASSLVALKAQKIDLNSIDDVMLSHLHGDHFGALPFFLLDAQFLARHQPHAQRALQLVREVQPTWQVQALLDQALAQGLAVRGDGGGHRVLVVGQIHPAPFGPDAAQEAAIVAVTRGTRQRR